MLEMKSVLTVRASSIGDCLMGKYLLENIHVAYPDAKCSLLVAGRVDMIRNLLLAYPWINVIEANRKHPMTIVSAIKDIFPSDLTVTQYSGRGKFATASKIFARLVTKPGRLVGFTDTSPMNRFLYDRLIPFDRNKALRLEEQAALSSLGIKSSVERLSLMPRGMLPITEKLFLREKGYIILHLFTGSVNRGMSLDRQIQLARALFDTFAANSKLILTAGPGEETFLSKIIKEVPGAIPVSGLTLQELIVLVSKSIGVVSIDTGVGHIAAETDTPLVLFRPCAGYTWWHKDQYPGNKLIVLSRDDVCTTCSIDKNFPRCLNAITVEEIVAAAESLFNK
ncbi:MAG: hypothetical protein HZA94_03455 [Candidatus Vogelbacteria bacterium]|nr:hypothetical protein [Candidatus Vogelbacteria bacterium]